MSRINTVKMTILPKLVNLLSITTKFFIKIKRNNHKLHMETQIDQNSQSNPEL